MADTIQLPAISSGATLHLLNRATHAHGTWEEMMRALGEQDPVLLIEDGVTSLIRPPKALMALGERLYVLEEDLQARGVTSLLFEIGAQRIDMQGFVLLTERCERIISWF
ncbi:hypothetical protein BH688_04275 [Kushneria phosphatilytica]|nr:hypothetical protein BH688_04275 [Kushneria phosphatilytica]